MDTQGGYAQGGYNQTGHQLVKIPLTLSWGDELLSFLEDRYSNQAEGEMIVVQQWHIQLHAGVSIGLCWM